MAPLSGAWLITLFILPCGAVLFRDPGPSSYTFLANHLVWQIFVLIVFPAAFGGFFLFRGVGTRPRSYLAAVKVNAVLTLLTGMTSFFQAGASIKAMFSRTVSQGKRVSS